MSLLDAHIPQLVASQSAFATKAALMRSTISQAEQEAMSAQAFHTGAYSETDANNAGLGLSYAAKTASDIRTELG